MNPMFAMLPLLPGTPLSLFFICSNVSAIYAPFFFFIIHFSLVHISFVAGGSHLGREV